MGEALAPLQLPADLRLSTEQFVAVCAANPQLVLELTADGHFIHIPPIGGDTSARNSRLVLGCWPGQSLGRLAGVRKLPVASACRMPRCSAPMLLS